MKKHWALRGGVFLLVAVLAALAWAALAPLKADSRDALFEIPAGTFARRMAGDKIETLPDTMVRFRLKPGPHTITFEFEGQRKSATVDGKAGDVRYVRIDGMVWSWKSTYEWASEPEAAIRERATKARLVADVTAR